MRQHPERHLIFLVGREKRASADFRTLVRQIKGSCWQPASTRDWWLDEMKLLANSRGDL
jgi:hypothetical protein